MDLISRAAAKAAGLKRYFTGLPCKKAGHVCERYVVKYACTECNSEKNNAARAANPAKRTEYDRLWRRTHPEYQRRRRGQTEPPTRLMPDACEGCGKPRDSKSLAADHDHTTGLFRGWFCLNCNTAFGKLGDSPTEVMRRLRSWEKAIEQSNEERV